MGRPAWLQKAEEEEPHAELNQHDIEHLFKSYHHDKDKHSSLKEFTKLLKGIHEKESKGHPHAAAVKAIEEAFSTAIFVHILEEEEAKHHKDASADHKTTHKLEKEVKHLRRELEEEEAKHPGIQQAAAGNDENAEEQLRALRKDYRDEINDLKFDSERETKRLREELQDATERLGGSTQGMEKAQTEALDLMKELEAAKAKQQELQDSQDDARHLRQQAKRFKSEYHSLLSAEEEEVTRMRQERNEARLLEGQLEKARADSAGLKEAEEEALRMRRKGKTHQDRVKALEEKIESLQEELEKEKTLSKGALRLEAEAYRLTQDIEKLNKQLDDSKRKLKALDADKEAMRRQEAKEEGCAVAEADWAKKCQARLEEEAEEFRTTRKALRRCKNECVEQCMEISIFEGQAAHEQAEADAYRRTKKALIETEGELDEAETSASQHYIELKHAQTTIKQYKKDVVLSEELADEKAMHNQHKLELECAGIREEAQDAEEAEAHANYRTEQAMRALKQAELDLRYQAEVTLVEARIQSYEQGKEMELQECREHDEVLREEAEREEAEVNWMRAEERLRKEALEAERAHEIAAEEYWEERAKKMAERRAEREERKLEEEHAHRIALEEAQQRAAFAGAALRAAILAQDTPRCFHILSTCRSAEVNSKDDLGRPALIWAAKVGLPEVFLSILHRQDFTEINAHDAWGYTALSMAAESSLPGACLAVLQRHDFVQIDAKNWEGRDALFYAERGGLQDVINAIRGARKNLNLSDSPNRTGVSANNFESIVSPSPVASLRKGRSGAMVVADGEVPLSVALSQPQSAIHLRSIGHIAATSTVASAATNAASSAKATANANLPVTALPAPVGGRRIPSKAKAGSRARTSL
eukprot:gnl/MRDRNA2_/MRDRNA2_61876_c0_seq1.p1 gnl/MRDRNA2_/MRDRNA2_61876_c0~~gnl/MRDRNA2_/MRDRNA2_61876_c0_seq1.p1  ORF type:complete len:877 (+),score=283.31 gnl/MRDRNA2_/MRDRNA2_61876_c0_seq1:216-2846(+)